MWHSLLFWLPPAAVEQATKKRSPISIEIKKTSNMMGVSALASPTNSVDSDNESEQQQHHHGGKDKEKEPHSKDKDKEKKEEKEKDKEQAKDKDVGKRSRREELLKQLRAVEDAIAKKRSKLT